jgi:hypothetical protein
MADGHIILLPLAGYYDWRKAAHNYALSFGVNFTSDPATAGQIATTVTIAGAPEGYPDQGDIEAWFHEHCPAVTVDYVPAADPAALELALRGRVAAGDEYAPVNQPPTYPWPPGRCLIGLHGRTDGPMEASDFEAVRLARIEAVKLLTWARPADVDRLRAIRPDIFILMRLMTKIGAPDQFSDFFVSEVQAHMAAFYARGLRYFEIHNEPNLTLEGWRSSWQNGADFARFFVEVRNALKAQFPEALFGWPGLSPGPALDGVRQKDWDFLAEAADAVRLADWIGVHCYWQAAATMEDEADGGRVYRGYRQQFPDKLIFVTEFSNATEPPAVKGQQYIDYYRSLRDEPGLGAAFSYVVSASTGFATEVWRTETGAQTEITHVVGGRPDF